MDEYLKCPNCGSRRFYVETDAGMVFFHLDESGAVQEPKGEVPDLEARTLFCISCAWEGSKEQVLTFNADEKKTSADGDACS